MSIYVGQLWGGDWMARPSSGAALWVSREEDRNALRLGEGELVWALQGLIEASVGLDGPHPSRTSMLSPQDAVTE